MVPFKAVSLSHESAPVEIRELIYLPEEDCKLLLLQLKESLGIQEALIFSTCNRTEVYYVSQHDLSHEIVKILGIARGVAEPASYYPYFQVFNEEEQAVRYLFEVSMGLHSNVLGDLQISSQIKQAYVWANEADMAGAFMHRMLHTIFHTNKRVHQETPFRDGAASVSYASAELAHELSGTFEHPAVLVVGLGEMGRDVARNLEPERFRSIHLCNRTLAKAEVLAQDTGAEVLPMEELADRLVEFDLIISAVSVKEPLLTPEMMAGAGVTPKFMVDLCVPRSIAKEVEDLPQVVLYNVDDINARTSQTLARRRESMPQVREIIAQEMIGFMEWRSHLSVSPTIHKIKNALEQIRKEEVARFLKNASKQEEKLVEEVTRGMMNKFLKLPVLQLKDACKRGEQDELIDLLNELFDLERKREKS